MLLEDLAHVHSAALATGDFSKSTFCYEAIQRVFRPAMVRHIRNVLQSEFPDNWKASLRSCFSGPDWQKVEDSALRFEASQTLDARAADEFDYLGVNNFHAVVSRHFPLLFPEQAAWPEQARAERRASILRSLKEVKDLRDGMSHPVSDDFSAEDAIVMMRHAEKVLIPVDPAAAARVRELMRDAMLVPGLSQQISSDSLRVTDASAGEAVESMVLNHGPIEAYSALGEFFRSNALALESYLPEHARAHAEVAAALERLLSLPGDIVPPAQPDLASRAD